MRVIGLDIGQKRIGVARSDASGRLATPVETVMAPTPAAAAARIATLAAECGAQGVVVGLPVELSGKEGHAVRRTRRFVEVLQRVLPLEVFEWDERLTSAAAERSLIESGVSRRERKDVVDQAAAVLILQGWLDSRAQR